MRGISRVSTGFLAVAVGMSSIAHGLTEQQFLEDALKNHPDVVAAEAERAAAAGQRRQAGAFSDPELAWEREDPDMSARQDSWRLSWRLPLDGRRHRLAEADAVVAASEARIDAALLGARLELRELFATWYVTREREQALRLHLDTAQRLAVWLRARADQGEAAGVEARRLELEVEVLSRRLVEASAEAAAQRAAAAVWSDLVSAGALPERPALAQPPTSVEISARPELRYLEHRVVEAEARQSLSRRVLEPPEVSVGWLEIRDGMQSFDGPVLGVTWPVPLGGRSRGRREAAAAEVDRSRAVLEAGRRRARQRAESALASYARLHDIAAPIQAGTSSSDVVEPMLAAFEAGEASLTDVLDSLRTATDARLARLESLAAVLGAGRELEEAVGQPILAGGDS
jgi:cobalt-zinc-cadmium efflux system outer membrane protein